jgi:hypothetical protein
MGFVEGWRDDKVWDLSRPPETCARPITSLTRTQPGSVPQVVRVCFRPVRPSAADTLCAD